MGVVVLDVKLTTLGGHGNDFSRNSFKNLEEDNLAERGGFEPPVGFSHSRFPGVCIKPLCHLSVGCPNLVSRRGAGNLFQRANS